MSASSTIQRAKAFMLFFPMLIMYSTKQHSLNKIVMEMIIPIKMEEGNIQEWSSTSSSESSSVVEDNNTSSNSNSTISQQQLLRRINRSNIHHSIADHDSKNASVTSNLQQTKDKKQHVIPKEKASSSSSSMLPSINFHSMLNLFEKINCTYKEDDAGIYDQHIPALIIGGTQKGGTTALYRLLQLHPNITTHTNKIELHFFDFKIDSNSRKQLLQNHKLLVQQEEEEQEHQRFESLYHKQSVTTTTRRRRYRQRRLSSEIEQDNNNNLNDTGASSSSSRSSSSSKMNANISSEVTQLICKQRKNYVDSYPVKIMKEIANKNVEHNSIMLYEKTPKYMNEFIDTPEFISMILPWTKMIFVIRNPVERAFSHYRMSIDTNIDKRPFDSIVLNELPQLITRGLLGQYVKDQFQKIQQQQQQKTQQSKNGAVGSSPPLVSIDSLNELIQKSKPHIKDAILSGEIERTIFDNPRRIQRIQGGYLFRGFYSIFIKQWKRFFPIAKMMKNHIENENDMEQQQQQQQKLMVLEYNALNQNPQGVIDIVYNYIGASPYQIANEEFKKDYGPIKSSKRGYSNQLKMSNITKQLLQAMYEPFNEELPKVLEDEYWNDIWK